MIHTTLLPINVSDLLHGKSVEWERLEFKAGWNPLDIVQTICAFANDFHNLSGGYLIVGVAEQDGRPVLPPVGVSEDANDAIQKELLNLGHTALQPAYHPVVMPYTLADRTIVIIWAPGGQTRPYKARLGLGKENKEFGYFIRKGSSTVRARGADEIELLSLAATVPFDDRLNQQAQVTDLDQTLMVDFLRDVDSALAATAPTMPLLELGCQMHVIGGPTEAPFPLNVGPLFFNREPHRFFTVTQIDVVWFPNGPDRSIRMDQLRMGRAVTRRYRNHRIYDSGFGVETPLGAGADHPPAWMGRRKDFACKPDRWLPTQHYFSSERCNHE